MTVRRVTHGDQGQYDYSVGLSLEDIREILEALRKECSLPAISEGLQPAMLDLFRLQAAAAGLLMPKQ
jgi:DNA-binding transcriptional MerR regulator